MTTWGRLEILPDLLGLRRRWIAARARRRQEREWRIESASRDAIFFAAIAAQASEAMIFVALFAIAACGNVLGSFIFGGLISYLKPVLATVGLVSALVGVVYVLMAIRSQREWREAVARRSARAARQPMV